MEKKRHNIFKRYSLQKVVEYKLVNVDTSAWTNLTVEGLVEFLQNNIPDWQDLVVTKSTIIIDPKKKEGNSIVGEKRAKLKLARIPSDKLCCVKVDENLTKNGVIPVNLGAFFEEKNVGR